MHWRMSSAVVIILCLSASPGFASTAGISYPEVQHLILRQARSAGVPPSLAMEVARVESGFNPAAVSPAGAIGVMQIMPQTGKGEFGVEESELRDPRTNVRIGVEFLRQLYLHYDKRWDLALSHYNGGSLTPGDDWQPHDYTLGYIARVMAWKRVYDFQQQLWAGVPEQQVTDDGINITVIDIPAPEPATAVTGSSDVAFSDRDFATRLRIAERSLDDFPVTETGEGG